MPLYCPIDHLQLSQQFINIWFSALFVLPWQVRIILRIFLKVLYLSVKKRSSLKILEHGIKTFSFLEQIKLEKPDNLTPTIVLANPSYLFPLPNILKFLEVLFLKFRGLARWFKMRSEIRKIDSFGISNKTFRYKNPMSPLKLLSFTFSINLSSSFDRSSY